MCALAGYWLLLALRYASMYWLENPAGRIWAIQDDMYISASFARTLADGNGLRWYAGAPKVEGFSNPAWVALMAAFHALPGFSPSFLGALLFAVNAVALTLLAATIVAGLMRLHTDAPRSGTWRWVVLLALAPGCASLCVAAGHGFELPVLALLVTLAFVEGLRPAHALRPGRIGLLVGLAFWTRMDGLVSAAPAIALALCKIRGRAGLARLLGVAGSMIAALLLARRAYYGEWYPNTYFLKISGWPLDNRLHHGWFQNVVTLTALASLLLPLAVFGWFRLERRHRPALLALAAAPLCVVYSTTNGGDFIWPAFGYDRFASTGTALLILGLGVLLLKARVSWWQAPLLCAWTLAIIAVPSLISLRVDPGPRFTYGMNSHAARALFDPRSESNPPRELLAAELIYRGELLEEFTEPGARIAVCDAGAQVYFSRRGGVDILGKIEPYIAHLPAMLEPPPERRCWRGFAPSGHNKEDVPGLFRLRRPELSQVVPPVEQAESYVTISYKGRQFHARRDTALVRWRSVVVSVAPRDRMTSRAH